jgi:hypothetical protein
VRPKPIHGNEDPGWAGGNYGRFWNIHVSSQTVGQIAKKYKKKCCVMRNVRKKSCLDSSRFFVPCCWLDICVDIGYCYRNTAKGYSSMYEV